MNYSKHSVYRVLTKKEKKFLNEWIDKLKEQFRSRELEEEFFINIDATIFVHKDQIIQLFFQSDEFGSVPDVLSKEVPQLNDLKELGKVIANPKEMKLRDSKDVYGKGAFKRWQKKGLVSDKGSTLTLGGRIFNIIREGEKFRLVVPGQTELPLKTQGERDNEKERRSIKSKLA